LRFQLDSLANGNSASQLWVMLPGAYMKPADFIEAGFIQTLRSRQLPHDVALLEATVVDVANGSALLFLQDFLRAEGTKPRRICLLGISLGAHLALACLASGAKSIHEAQAAARISCACLLAPYLGPRDIVAEVSSSGTLAQWQPPPFEPEDIDRRIWQWLQRMSEPTAEIYLGYGREDRFAKAHALLAQALPASHVDVVPGIHSWSVWSALWNRHLDDVYAPT
jgi:hypothetical protein